MGAFDSIDVAGVRYVKELYPRVRPLDDVIERYRTALEKLPPIAVARGGILVDGYHRWQAHVREGAEKIQVVDLGNLSDAEIVRESIARNATHGEQLSQADKKKMAGKLWGALADMRPAERVTDIAKILSVSDDTVRRWTKDERKAEKDDAKARAWDLWLDCKSQTEIAKEMGVPKQTIDGWLSDFRQASVFGQPPESRQHFDVWQFATTDRDGGGQQSYFGAVPPQLVENLLWFYTEPGETVVDLFAGSGTTIDVAKRMGRRVWASDIRGNHYSPHLPIHEHDAGSAWPKDAPKRADIVFLDPPYWKQAAGRYSQEPGELAEMDLERFTKAWAKVVAQCVKHAKRIAYIISPTQNEDGTVVDHATMMLAAFKGWRVERRIVVPYSTQQATGQQVTWAREKKRMLKLYRDLVVMVPA